jgi:hypothetical protein
MPPLDNGSSRQKGARRSVPPRESRGDNRIPGQLAAHTNRESFVYLNLLFTCQRTRAARKLPLPGHAPPNAGERAGVKPAGSFEFGARRSLLRRRSFEWINEQSEPSGDVAIAVPACADEAVLT